MKPDALPTTVSLPLAAAPGALTKAVMAQTHAVHLGGPADGPAGEPAGGQVPIKASPKGLPLASPLAASSVVQWSDRALSHALQHGEGSRVLQGDVPDFAFSPARASTPVPGTMQGMAAKAALALAQPLAGGGPAGLADRLQAPKTLAQNPSPAGGSGLRWPGPALTHTQPPGAGGVAVARLPWPSGGLGALAQGQAVQLLQALPMGLPGSKVPVALLSAQLWSPGFLAQWLADRDAAGPATQPLQLWASQQLRVQTPAGQQHLSMQLWVGGEPAGGQTEATQPSAVPQPSTSATTTPASLANQATPAGPTGAMRWPASPWPEAGALAGVLKSEGGAVLNALLVLEWGPRREQLVYGKDLLQTRPDPWLLHGQWLVQGVKERQPPSAADEAPCDTPGCPYRGLAACPQPFCPATGAVAAVSTAAGV